MRGLRTLAARLVIGQALVILAGSATLVLVATALGPGIFHRHVRESLVRVSSGELDHLDHAFQDTLLLALAAAVAVAAVTALAISLLVAARIAAPVRRLAAAAERVAGGERGVRVSLAGADELRAVSASFNAMAATLERSETDRRAFIADIAHELRTPLATIDGHVEGLEDGVVAPGADTWRLLRSQTRRLRRLIDDLATLTRAEDGRLDLHRERVSLEELLERAVQAARPAYLAKGIHLASSSPSIDVVVDTDRIGEVLANLLDNALRHTPPAGTVTVDGETSGEHVRIVVADSGEGIPADQLARVFDRLHRADASRTRQTGGSGLGLTICQLLVEAHGGTIHAESDGAGLGARLVIDLPGHD